MNETPAARADYMQQFTVICLGSFLAPLLVHSSTLAIPAIADSLSLRAGLLSWIPMALVLGNAISQFPAGKLGDKFGRKNVYLAGLLIGAITSLIAASATSAYTLVAARFFQGIGNAAIFATSLALIFDITPENKRAKYTGLYVAIAYLGITSGPLFGGVVINHLDWRAVFWMPAPLFAMAAVLAYVFLDTPGSELDDSPFDFSGSLIYAIGVICIAPGLLDITDSAGQLGIAAGVILLLVFVFHQHSKAHPLVDVDLFIANRAFGFSSLVIFFFNMAIYSIPFALTLFLQYIQALSAQAAGLVLMIQAISTSIMASLSGRFSHRFSGMAVVYAGIFTGLAALLLLSQLTQSSGLLLPVTALILIGTSAGLLETPLIGFMMASVSEKSRGTASATINTMRMLGSFTSIGVISILLSIWLGDAMITAATHGGLLSAIGGYFVLAVLMVAAAALCLKLADGSRQREEG